jgi:hypothetical protein
MKPVLVIALVLLIVLIGVPLAHGMPSMSACPACRSDAGATALGACLAILVLLTLAAPTLLTALRLRSSRVVPLLLASVPYRPPRVG